MEEKRPIIGPVLAALVLLLLLPSVYLGSYYLSMEPLNSVVIKDEFMRLGKVPDYHWGTPWSDILYSPAHWIDCRLRPQFWEMSGPKELPPDFDVLQDDLSNLNWDANGRLLSDGSTVDESPDGR
jgi:hypothetical protein